MILVINALSVEKAKWIKQTEEKKIPQNNQKRKPSQNKTNMPTFSASCCDKVLWNKNVGICVKTWKGWNWMILVCYFSCNVQKSDLNLFSPDSTLANSDHYDYLLTSTLLIFIIRILLIKIMNKTWNIITQAEVKIHKMNVFQ